MCMVVYTCVVWMGLKIRLNAVCLGEGFDSQVSQYFICYSKVHQFTISQFFNIFFLQCPSLYWSVNKL